MLPALAGRIPKPMEPNPLLCVLAVAAALAACGSPPAPPGPPEGQTAPQGPPEPRNGADGGTPTPCDMPARCESAQPDAAMPDGATLPDATDQAEPPYTDAAISPDSATSRDRDGATSSRSDCTPLARDRACLWKNCGTVPDGCGGEYACGKLDGECAEPGDQCEANKCTPRCREQGGAMCLNAPSMPNRTFFYCESRPAVGCVWGNPAVLNTASDEVWCCP